MTDGGAPLAPTARATSMALVVAGNLIYHLAQKAVPRGANPAAVLLLAYGVGGLVCLALLVAQRAAHPIGGLPPVHWSSGAVGIGVVAIELGFLLAYRSGWPIGAASLVGNVSVALLLLPIGIIGFGESWNLSRTLGVALCLIGLWCVARG